LRFKQKKTKNIIILICLVIILLLSIPKIKDTIMYNLYPIKYEEYVYKYAQEYKIDPLLIFAIIKAESNFNEKALSSSNAIGLMQLLEKTAEEIAIEDLGMEGFKKEDLYNPELNIRIGLKYFSKLLKEYEYSYNLALAAYNGGTGNVRKWIEQGIISESGEDIENIPFKETNNYVRKILRDYKIYQELYI